MSETLLKLENITQRFGGLTAIADVSIHVDKGEIVGLIGPNGAGKTTTFNVITGVYNPTEGRVFYRGKEITGEAIHRVTAVGMARTFQNIRLFKSLSILDNVKIGMHLDHGASTAEDMFHAGRWKKNEKKTEREAMKLLALTGLAQNADDTAADSLPYGSQRRLEIVRAMATGAELLLLDEPAAGMNEQETADLMKFIRELRDKGYTVFLIEHDMKLVMNLCDRIYVQNQGHLIAEGAPEEIQSNEAVIDADLGTEV